jgi:hypothetical protein
MQLTLEETVRAASKSAYISTLFLRLDEEEQEKICTEDSSITENLTISFISSSFLKKEFIKENDKIANCPLIKNGEKGVSFLSSSIDLDEGIADIVVNYQVNLPFIPHKLFHLNLSNRCYIHLYTGKELVKEQSVANTYVYYTSYGRAFHFNRYCQYLLDYTEATNYRSINYYILGCRECVNISKKQLEDSNPIVYITQSKHCFHLSLKCPGFTGNVFRTHYSSLDKDDKICQKCLEGK